MGLGACVFEFLRYEIKVLSVWSCDRSALETVVYCGVDVERVVILIIGLLRHGSSQDI